mgnify:FL=1
MEDIASIYEAEKSRGSISRYNGQETISISIKKQQSSTAMEVSKAVQKAVASLEAADDGLTITVARDTADTILSSLQDVAVTMVLAVVISMAIIFIFFGDYKASLIVGSSIPTSILLSMILMTSAGFSLNVITMSALVLGVGMMVDNSIVVLESCFRATADSEDRGLLGYAKAALGGTGIVVQSILGSTVTTCVVFIPLAFLQGMTGQMFKPMGYTIVFCMMSSLLSAMTVVPLCYLMYKPKETERAPSTTAGGAHAEPVPEIMGKLLGHRLIVMGVSVVIVVVTVILASGMESELMTADDTGTSGVTIETRPGILSEQAEDMLNRAEAVVKADPNVESYMLRYNNNSGTITGYLRDDRDMSTDDVADKWKKEMADIDNCTITVEASSSMSFMRRRTDYQVILHGTQYDELKEVSDKIVKEMTDRDDVINVHSSIENTAPIVTVKVDPVMAAAEGLSASRIGSMVKQMLSGVEATTLKVDGQEVSVMVEYPEDEYRTIDQLKGIILTKPSGGYVALEDVAEIYFKDSPSSISKTDKSYEITITADYTQGNVKAAIDSEVISPNLTGTITTGVTQWTG